MRRLRARAFLGLLLLAGCGGGGSNSPGSPATFAPTQTPSTPAGGPTSSASPVPSSPASGVPPTVTPPVASPSASPSAISLNPASLSFTVMNSQSTTASEANYSGAFTSSGTSCNGIATISASGATFTVTPQSSGSCTFTISDTLGNTAQLPIGVTLTSGVISIAHRKH